jgi:phage terminase small subunit
MEGKLTQKQQRFVAEYLVDLNATQAAIRAGYSEQTAYSIGHENLNKPDIQEAIKNAQEELGKRVELSQEMVIRNIQTIANRCMQSEMVVDRKGAPVVIENEDGQYVPAYTFDAGGALKAMELLGKHIGMFTTKLQLGGDPDGAPIKTEIAVRFVSSDDGSAGN